MISKQAISINIIYSVPVSKILNDTHYFFFFFGNVIIAVQESKTQKQTSNSPGLERKRKWPEMQTKKRLPLI